MIQAWVAWDSALMWQPELKYATAPCSRASTSHTIINRPPSGVNRSRQNNN
jgi:hypothetical protein